MSTKKIFAIILSCIVLISCELETSDNGALDGNWQMRQIDTLSTGGMCDMSQSSIYWGFENKVLQLRDIDKGNLKIFFRFKRDEDNLTIYEPYKHITKDEVVALENNELLLPFGIIRTQDTFHVECLTHHTLILTNDAYRLHFRKY